MPDYARTKTLIDQTLHENWLTSPTSRWGHVENFCRPPVPAAMYDIAVGANAASDIQVAARTAAQLAASANPYFCLTGRNAANGPSEAVLADAGGGVALSSILTGVAANDSSAFRPMTAFSLFQSGPVANFQLNTSLSPHYDLVVTHATSFTANNDTGFHFQAGLRTSSGWDPTAANYDETNNAGADGAFFSTSATGTLQCNTRIGSVTTTLDTGVTMIDKTRWLAIRIDANRVPVFLIDNTSYFSMAALTATRQLLPMVSIKTLAVAQKIVKIRGMRFSKLLA